MKRPVGTVIDLLRRGIVTVAERDMAAEWKYALVARAT